MAAGVPLLGGRVVLEVARDGVADDGDQLVGGDAEVDGPLDALLLGAGSELGRRVLSIAITVDAVSVSQ